MQKLLSYMRSACQQYDMIKDGDRIAVGVSGGKDSMALLAAMASSFTACFEVDTPKNEEPTSASEETQTQITVEVVCAEHGTQKTFTVKTDKTNVGDALIEEGLIEGEEGAYGWFVTKVDGEFHNFDDDGKYWALYIDGEYAMTGVSSTPITAGTTYTFKAE